MRLARRLIVASALLNHELVGSAAQHADRRHADTNHTIRSLEASDRIRHTKNNAPGPKKKKKKKNKRKKNQQIKVTKHGGQ